MEDKNDLNKNSNENLKEENKTKKADLKSTTNKALKKKQPKWWVWPVKILVIAVFLSLSFSVLSEMLLSSVGIAISVLVIVLLLAVGIISDMIGVASTACSIEPFAAMRSRKVKGAKIAMAMVKNSEKVASICNDVVGDICGILSGAAGASIAVKFVTDNMGNSLQILIAGAVSAIIAGLTIFGKAVCKKYAIDNSTKIILGVGKCLSIFSRNKDGKKSKKSKKEQ